MASPVTYIKRQAEGAYYGYDFTNDQVIGVGGDPIASVVSVVSVIMTQGQTVNITLGNPTFLGTVVSVLLTGGADGCQYKVTFTVETVGGLTRVGIGYLVVNDEG